MKGVYLDNAATTFPKPVEVYDYMMEMYKISGINFGRNKGNSSEDIDEIVKSTRVMIKELAKATHEYETIFEPSSTIALNQILFGLNYNNIKNIYITKFEHNAVLRTLHEIKKNKDVKINFLEFNSDTWCYDLEKIKYDFAKEKPDLIIMNHVSNVFGYITDINEIYEISKEYNPISVIDASQSLGVEEIDLTRFKFDFIVFAGHKTLYAPFGIAGFIMNKNINLKPYIFGGTGIESANMDMPNDLPTRYEAGSMNILSVFGLYKALLWNKEIGRENIRNREIELTENLVEVIQKYDFIESYIPCKNHIGIVSFKIKGYPVDSMAQVLSDEYGISLRSGLHCAPLAHEISDTVEEGTIRVSIGYFTTKDDLAMLDEALNEIEYEI